MADNVRVISLIDMDCFYVQVERQKNPNLVGKPIILCQHGSTNGVALSVSYEARDFGVKRHMNIREAKQICPVLEVVFVPQMADLDKGDLTCYKEASDSIFDVMLDFCGPNVVIEKASVDEAYLDLTKEVDRILIDKTFRNILSSPDEMLQEHMPSTYAVYTGKGANFETTERTKCLESFLKSCSHSKADMALLAGSFFMEQLRKAIFDKTHYHCSAGIANNKMLAKLAASRHKPKSQTVLPLSETIPYLSLVPIQSVRWFGGKFGKAIVESLKIKNVGQIHSIPIEKLKRVFSDDFMKIINLSNGVCLEPVVQRIMPKSLSVAKALYSVDREKILQWVNGLMTELLRRLENDQHKFQRTAQQIDIGATFENGTRGQKSFSIVHYKFEPIYRNVKKFFSTHYGNEDESTWTPGISYMSLNASKFGPLKKNVLTMNEFFKRKSSLPKSSEDATAVLALAKRDKPEGGANVPEATKAVPQKRKRIATPTKTASKNKREAKVAPAGAKQMKLDFTAVAVQKPLQIDTTIDLDQSSTIELSSDSDFAESHPSPNASPRR